MERQPAQQVEQVLLIVDDDKLLRDLSRDVLISEGVVQEEAIIAAESVNDAEQKLDARIGRAEVAAIITDYHFPLGRAQREGDPEGPAQSPLAVIQAVRARGMGNPGVVVATGETVETLDELGFTEEIRASIGHIALLKKGKFDIDQYIDFANRAMHANQTVA